LLGELLLPVEGLLWVVKAVALVAFSMVAISRAVEVAAMVMLVGLSGQAIQMTRKSNNRHNNRHNKRHNNRHNNRRNNRRNNRHNRLIHRVHGSTVGRKPI
jgi:predicted histidine transporter YuiF (NhaC family)